MSKFAQLEIGQLEKAIDSIKRRLSTAQTEIQKLAVQCIAQSILHRNASPATRLLGAMGHGMQRQKLVNFFEYWGNLRYSKTKKGFEYAEKIEGADDEYFAGLMAQPWYKAGKEEELVSTYDVQLAVTKFLESCRKKIEKVRSSPNGNVENVELLAAITNAVAKFNSDSAAASAEAGE